MFRKNRHFQIQNDSHKKLKNINCGKLSLFLRNTETKLVQHVKIQIFGEFQHCEKYIDRVMPFKKMNKFNTFAVFSNFFFTINFFTLCIDQKDKNYQFTSIYQI